MKSKRIDVLRGGCSCIEVQAGTEEAIADRLIRRAWQAIGYPGKRCSVRAERTENGWRLSVQRHSVGAVESGVDADALEASVKDLDDFARPSTGSTTKILTDAVNVKPKGKNMKIKTLGLLASLLCFPLLARAETTHCWLITQVLAQDISSGAVTTAEISMNGVPRGSRYNELPTYLKIGVDLVDADDLVSNIQLTFTAAEASGGTFRSIPLCADAAPTLTCGAVDVDWDPQTHGKNWWVKPVDWGYPFGKITTTPTGHGSGDTVAFDVYGCRE